MPRKVQLVWHGLNDDTNIRQYLASDIEWAEFDVRTDPDGRLIVRHDSFEETPVGPGEEFLPLEDVLKRLKKFEKSAKIDLKEGDDVLDRVSDLVGALDFAPETLWFNGHIEIGSICETYAFVIECSERQEVGSWTARVSRCGFRRRAG